MIQHEGKGGKEKCRKVIRLSKNRPGCLHPLESWNHIASSPMPVSDAKSSAEYSNVLSDAILEQLEQLESVPEYDSSDPASEAVCGKVSCKMECQVSSLGIDDE